MDSKICCVCERKLPVSRFYPSRNGTPSSLCKNCQNDISAGSAARQKKENPVKFLSRRAIYTRNWRKKNPEKFKFIGWRAHLKNKFKITVGHYMAAARLQNNLCAICGNPPAAGKKLAVDHNHKTRAFRGLLCANCNMALERVEAIPDWENKARQYLNRDSLVYFTGLNRFNTLEFEDMSLREVQ